MELIITKEGAGFVVITFTVFTLERISGCGRDVTERENSYFSRSKNATLLFSCMVHGDETGHDPVALARRGEWRMSKGPGGPHGKKKRVLLENFLLWIA